MDKSTFYLHSGSQLAALAAYFYLASEIQGYCSSTFTVTATALQYIRSNQVNDHKGHLLKKFNGDLISHIFDRLNQKQMRAFNRPTPLVDFDNEKGIYVPSLALISLGCLMSRTGVKVWTMTMVYFGTAYNMIHQHRPKRIDLPPELKRAPKAKKDHGESGPIQPSPNKAWGQLRKKANQNKTQEILSFFLKENENGISKYSLSQIHAPLSEEAINKSSRLIIAWLFPRYHTLPDLPVLTSSVVEAFQKDDEQGQILRNRFHTGLILILDHYGLKLNGSGNVAKNSVKFNAQAEKYLKPGSRHLTRIQWILHSLVDLGQLELAQSFCTFLDGYTQDEKRELRSFFEECNRIVHPPKTEVRRALFTPTPEEPARDNVTQGVLDFFLGNGKGSCAHLFDDIVTSYSEGDLERYHNFIQWLFPTHRKSNVVSNPPILNPEIIGAFNAVGAQGEQLRLSMRLGFVRMLRHYGLQLDGDGRVQRNQVTFDDQSKKYLKLGNHNILRITRILSSLEALGQVQLAKAFYNFLDDYTQNECENLRPTFNQYWKPICDWDLIPNPGPTS